MQREEKNRWRGLKMAGGILHGSGNERPGPCCLRASCHRHSRESTFARRDGRLANQQLGDYVCPHVGEHRTAGHDIVASSDLVSLFHWLPFERWCSRSKPGLRNASMSVFCPQPPSVHDLWPPPIPHARLAINKQNWRSVAWSRFGVSVFGPTPALLQPPCLGSLFSMRSDRDIGRGLREARIAEAAWFPLICTELLAGVVAQNTSCVFSRHWRSCIQGSAWDWIPGDSLG
jgi:hypothetical protein